MSVVLQDLPFKKGDHLIVVNNSEDPNWWLAKNKAGQVGKTMLPVQTAVSTFVCGRVGRDDPRQLC